MLNFSFKIYCKFTKSPAFMGYIYTYRSTSMLLPIKLGNKRFNNKFDYSKVKYINNKSNVNIICPIHGEFQMTPYEHLSSQFGCKQCAVQFVADKRKESNRETFFEYSRKIQENRYDYDEESYNGIESFINIKCPIHGWFKQIASYHRNGCGCPKCARVMSKGEDEIAEYIRTTFGYKISQRDRSVLKPRELDIYVPDRKIAIEYDGLIWHTENLRLRYNGIRNEIIILHSKDYL